jgi:hypothetical protein
MATVAVQVETAVGRGSDSGVTLFFPPPDRANSIAKSKIARRTGRCDRAVWGFIMARSYTIRADRATMERFGGIQNELEQGNRLQPI